MLQKSGEGAVEDNGNSKPAGKGKALPDNVHVLENNSI